MDGLRSTSTAQPCPLLARRRPDAGARPCLLLGKHDDSLYDGHGGAKRIESFEGLSQRKGAAPQRAEPSASNI